MIFFPNLFQRLEGKQHDTKNIIKNDLYRRL